MSTLLYTVFGINVLTILKEAGPEIFIQSHSLIVPFVSLEAEPSNEILSVGKVITWSGPARAIGSLLISPHQSQSGFRQERKTITPISDNINADKRILFIKIGLEILKLQLPYLV